MREKIKHKMRARTPETGNSAFDEYRKEMLQKLEEEREAFSDYIEALRRAQDRDAFEQFLAQRSKEAPRPEQGSATL